MSRPQTVAIRRADQADAGALQHLIAATIDACYPAAYPPRAVRFFKTFHSEEQVRARLRDGVTLVADEAGRPIATGTLAGHDVFGVFVEPTRQGRGWGRAIMAELERLAQAGGHAEVDLSVSLPSRRFYEALGYEIVADRTIDVGEGQRLDYWEARKPLPPADGRDRRRVSDDTP